MKKMLLLNAKMSAQVKVKSILFKVLQEMEEGNVPVSPSTEVRPQQSIQSVQEFNIPASNIPQPAYGG